MRKYPLILLIALLAVSCDSSSNEEGGEEQTDSTETTSIELPEAAGPAVSEGFSVEVLKEGNGERPQAGDILTLHYTATFAATADTFESSYKIGQPIEVPLGLGKLLPGWEEALKGMDKGSKIIAHVPSDMAFGSQGMPGRIPPNTDMVFTFEMLDFREGPKPIAHDIWETEGIEPIETNSGLRVYIIEEGNGGLIPPGNQAVVHYHGYLSESGEVFDSSFKRGEPFQFPLGAGRVIPGWDEGVAMLQVGTKAVLDIPYHLAYGENGMPPNIPPKANLTFDIEVLGLK